MERKLFNGIMTPGAVLSIVFWALAVAWLWHQAVAGCMPSSRWLSCWSAYHALCWKHLRAFRDDRNARSERYFRIINELPVFLLFGIVIFVVLKPF